MPPIVRQPVKFVQMATAFPAVRQSVPARSAVRTTAVAVAGLVVQIKLAITEFAKQMAAVEVVAPRASAAI